MPNSANPPLLKPDFPAPTEGFVVTTLLIVSDVARSRAFYERVFGAQKSGNPFEDQPATRGREDVPWAR
jgi:predicted enzyme related to lactoylglutathione lyase